MLIAGREIYAPVHDELERMDEESRLEKWRTVLDRGYYGPNDEDAFDEACRYRREAVSIKSSKQAAALLAVVQFKTRY